MTEDERRKRLEALRERMRRTDQRIERRKHETQRVLELVDLALAKLYASR
jgi:hypothetical protein